MSNTMELRSLTALRGVAAMAVVMQHFSATAQEHSQAVIPSLVPHGYLAVDLFFALSGFIMSYTYLDLFRRDGARAYGGFLVKRAARIVPLNLAVLAIFMLAGMASVALLGRNIIFASGSLAADLLANALMLQGLGIGHNLNGPSWSISTEFAAYLCFPALIAAAFHRRTAVAAGALLACVALLCLLAASQPRLGLGADGVGPGLVRCFTEFTLGMLSYRLLRSERVGILGQDGTVAALAASCAALMLLRVDLPAALLFPLLIAALAANEEGKAGGRAARLLSHPWLHFLGVVSFSTYLLHQLFRPTELALLRVLHPEPLGLPGALLFALAGSFSVLPFAWLAYRGIERPGRTFVQRAFARRAASAIAPPAPGRP
jgi:peptidoglycan/LPS O-acetylase OafA/YrhL